MFATRSFGTTPCWADEFLCLPAVGQRSRRRGRLRRRRWPWTSVRLRSTVSVSFNARLASADSRTQPSWGWLSQTAPHPGGAE